jgi:hypothetical protein
MHNLIKSLKITFKMTRPELEARNCVDTIQKRLEYAEKFMRDSPMDKRKIVFIDESGFNLHLRRQHGWSSIGKRAVVRIPTQRGSNINLISAINFEQSLHFKIRMLTTNANAFRTFLEELFTILSDLNFHGCWLIMDNVRFHKTHDIVSYIENEGHIPVFLPPYSPMLNPIECFFGKIKNTIRVNVSLTSRDNLINRITEAINGCNFADYQGWYRLMERNLADSLRQLPL